MSCTAAHLRSHSLNIVSLSDMIEGSYRSWDLYTNRLEWCSWAATLMLFQLPLGCRILNIMRFQDNLISLRGYISLLTSSLDRTLCAYFLCGHLMLKYLNGDRKHLTNWTRLSIMKSQQRPRQWCGEHCCNWRWNSRSLHKYKPVRVSIWTKFHI